MTDLTAENFEETINSKELVVVDFFATWCMPCRMLRPILEKVEKGLSNVKFYSVDIDQNEEIAKSYRIFSVPTVICFKEGKQIDSMVGLSSYDEILEFITRCGA